MKVLYEMEE